MTQARALSVDALSWSHRLVERAREAAPDLPHVDNNQVLLIAPEDETGREIRGFLMALGLEVFGGTDACAIGSDSLILISADDLRRPELRKKLDACRIARPSAPLCVVTGWHGEPFGTDTAAEVQPDDARTVLCAAGVRFLGEAGDRHAH